MSTYGYLAHHGIKGQKWGVRRYENPDGTLTEAGKKRYRTNLYDTEKGRKRLYGMAGKNAADRQYMDVRRYARKSVRQELKDSGQKMSLNDKNKKVNEKMVDEYTRMNGGNLGVGANEWLRGAAAHEINTARGLNIAQNALSAISMATIGIGIFGGSDPAGARAAYKTLTEKSIKEIDNKKTK